MGRHVRLARNWPTNRSIDEREDGRGLLGPGVRCRRRDETSEMNDTSRAEGMANERLTRGDWWLLEDEEDGRRDDRGDDS